MHPQENNAFFPRTRSCTHNAHLHTYSNICNFCILNYAHYNWAIIIAKLVIRLQYNTIYNRMIKYVANINAKVWITYVVNKLVFINSNLSKKNSNSTV